MKFENTNNILKLIDNDDIPALKYIDYWGAYLNEFWDKGNIEAIRYLRKKEIIKDIDLFNLSSVDLDEPDLISKSQKIIEIINENALDGTLYIDGMEIIYALTLNCFVNYIDLWRNAGAKFDYTRIVLGCFRGNEKYEVDLFNYILDQRLLDAEGLACATVSFIGSSMLSSEEKQSILNDMINRGLDLNYIFSESGKLQEFDSIPVQIFCYLIDFYDESQSHSIDISIFEDCSWEMILEFCCFDERHIKFLNRLVKEGVKLDLEDLRECLIEDHQEHFASLI